MKAAILSLARWFMPRAVRRAVRRIITAVALDISMHRLKKPGPPSRPVLHLLRFGWDNGGWTADSEYLALLYRYAMEVRGTILECGSGATTLLLAALANRTGARLISFEHSPEWNRRVQAALSRYGLRGELIHTPLRNFGEYFWYTVPDNFDPGEVELIVCDGPPSFPQGGRMGLLPMLSDHIGANTLILMDDAERDAEQRTIALWEKSYSTSASIIRYKTGAAAEVRLSRHHSYRNASAGSTREADQEGYSVAIKEIPSETIPTQMPSMRRGAKGT